MHNVIRTFIKRLILILVLFLFLQSCTGTVDFSKPLYDSPPLKMIDPMPLELSPKLINLVETAETSKFSYKVLAGKAFKSCFRYSYKPKGQLDLIDSQMSTNTGESISLGSNFICDYTITVSLKTAKRKETITAHGNGTSGLKLSHAAQYAVENAVLDLYKKVEAIMSE
jgi:hypothetical protein